MKKLLLFIVLIIGLSVFSHAEDINECKTDIYYGNGVWNEYEDATDSKDELESLIKDEIINGNSSLQTKYGTPKLAYNWGQGHLLDVLETYYQLRESGQLDGIGFYTAIAALTVSYPHITLSAIAMQALMEPFTKDWESGNVDEMWQKYYNESFKLGHRVLLVSHSQGNLFANRIYNTITPTEYQNYFANLQVASPASGIKATKGGYVTLCEDPIINPIPGSMFGNANGSPGHAFVNAYLDQIDPYTKIVAGIKQLLPTLDSEISQWETDEEFDRDSCDYKIAVKHSWDPDVEIVEKVYPFNAAKKLYQAKDENGVPYYVKASCGGENILSDWSSKKTNECYMIDNPQEEKIKKSLTLRYLYIVGSGNAVCQATTNLYPFMEGVMGLEYGGFINNIPINNQHGPKIDFQPIEGFMEWPIKGPSIQGLAGSDLTDALKQYAKELCLINVKITNDEVQRALDAVKSVYPDAVVKKNVDGVMHDSEYNNGVRQFFYYSPPVYSINIYE